MGNRINESFQYTLSTGRVKTFESAMNLYNSTVEPRRPRILLTPKGSTTLQNYTQPDQSSLIKAKSLAPTLFSSTVPDASQSTKLIAMERLAKNPS